MALWTKADFVAWRLRLGLSQSGAAKALGFEGSHVKSMEGGRRQVVDRTRDLCLHIEYERIQGTPARGLKRYAPGVCIDARPILERLGSLQRSGGLLAPGGRPKLRYLSLFSGLESATAAFERLGGEDVVAAAYCDNGAASQAVLHYRWPDVPIIDDVADFNFAPLRGYVDLVVAGPPCQSFSTAGLRRGLEDPRGSLTLYALRAIGALQPRYVVIENVAGSELPTTVKASKPLAKRSASSGSFSPGASSTQKHSGSPRDAVASGLLLSVLETRRDLKRYSITTKALDGLISRAARAGLPLPEEMRKLREK